MNSLGVRNVELKLILMYFGKDINTIIKKN